MRTHTHFDTLAELIQLSPFKQSSLQVLFDVFTIVSHNEPENPDGQMHIFGEVLLKHEPPFKQAHEFILV